MGVGNVSFAQIVKATEPVFAAFIGFMVPPRDIQPPLAYFMLMVIIGGVSLACVKEGKGIEINVAAFLYASLANVAASFKGKVSVEVRKGKAVFNSPLLTPSPPTPPTPPTHSSARMSPPH